jgi:tetratricopeptide (TPR) repeat protein
LSYKWGSSVISITRKFQWLISNNPLSAWHYDLLLVFCGLTFAYIIQKWLGSFQTFLGAAWGVCFGLLIYKVLAGKKEARPGNTLQKRRYLIFGTVFISTLGWCWATSVSYDTRLLIKGNEYFNKMEYDTAITVYTQVINEYPLNYEARAVRALAYKEKGDYDRAIEEYTFLIHKNPDNATLYNNLGTVYYRKGDYNSAINQYKKSIQLDQNLFAAYGNIGLIYLKQGNMREALPFLKKVFDNEDEMLEYVLTVYSSIKNQNG